MMDASAPNAAGAHGQILNVAQNINRAALAAHLPASLIADVFIEDERTRQDVMNVLRAIEAMSAAPVLQDRKRQLMGALQQHPQNPAASAGASPPQNPQSLQSAGMGLGAEYMLQASPAVEDLLLRILRSR